MKIYSSGSWGLDVEETWSITTGRGTGLRFRAAAGDVVELNLEEARKLRDSLSAWLASQLGGAVCQRTEDELRGALRGAPHAARVLADAVDELLLRRRWSVEDVEKALEAPPRHTEYHDDCSACRARSKAGIHPRACGGGDQAGDQPARVGAAEDLDR